ncbi:MAG: hypothetical protein K2H37_11260 [Lachnospiraceae bacterium]|nr:hypothetical protein [Lachnospiraceae bacterium]
MPKNTSIKIRLTEQEKKQLKKRAGSSKSMSAYILEKSLYTNSNKESSIIKTIETFDVLNAIVLQVAKSKDESLKKCIRDIVEGKMPNEY